MNTWATLEAPVITKFNSYCTCTYCPDCHIGGYAEELCSECGKDTIATEYCDESCWRLLHEDWEENLFPEFLQRNGNPTYLKIEGKRMGWQSRSGYKFIRADWDELYKSLILNGDFTLVITLAEKTLSVGRYSHDEPMGASLTVIPATEEEYENG